MQNVSDAGSACESIPHLRSALEHCEQKASTPKRSRRSAAAPSQLPGTLWFGGWLFTVGLVKLAWWKIPLAIVLWPYFLGANLR